MAFEDGSSADQVARALVDHSEARRAPHRSVNFRIDPGESSVDRLWDNGGGFTSFADYIRTASRHQAKLGLSAGEAERYQAWADASRAYRRSLAESVYPSVQRAVSSPDGMFENSEPDGGALIPPQFVKEVWDKARYRDTPFSRCRTITAVSNSGILPAISESSRVDGSRWGGLLSYWEGEAQQFVNTHPKLQDENFRLKKLTAMVPCSTEIFSDSALLDGFLAETVHKEFLFKTNEAMINGPGAGMPLGAVTAPGTITIAKDTGQATQTISSSNIQNMWKQFHGPSRANGVWYANEEFDVDTLGLPVSPLVGWVGEQPAPTLKGRYCLPLENCQPIGTPGDLILGDWSQYLMLFGGLRRDVSMHFKFDYHESYFRFVWRCDGMPLWQSPLTSIHGTLQKAPFLILAQR